MPEQRKTTSEKVLYFTSDNLAFFEKTNAEEHAAGLPDTTIVCMAKAQVDNALEELDIDSWDELDSETYID